MPTLQELLDVVGGEYIGKSISLQEEHSRGVGVLISFPGIHGVRLADTSRGAEAVAQCNAPYLRPAYRQTDTPFRREW